MPEPITVLVDEIDKHLNISLQMEHLPVLMEMFPKVQFIISTHSPFVNMGLVEKYEGQAAIIDLNNGGTECLWIHWIVTAKVFELCGEAEVV